MKAKQSYQYLTVTLTDQRSIKILMKDWPIIAESNDTDCDSEYEDQANQSSKWTLKVRQHKDGRALVYGIYSHDSLFSNKRNYYIRGGELLDSSVDIPAAVRRVGEWLTQQEHAEGDARRWEELINNCIANIPAEEI